MLLLNRVDVNRVLEMKDAIQVLEDAFADLAQGDVVMPQRPVIPVPEQGGLCAFMPAYLPHIGALGIKSVTSFKENARRFQLPTLFGMILLLDHESGRPLAIMDGTYLTNVRTGASSGVATRYLARPDARVLGVLGSGAQALTQIWAVCCVRSIEEVRIYSPNLKSHWQPFQRQVAELVDVAVRPVETAREAVERCDVVVVATSAAEPVLDGEWLSPGTHVNGVGSHAPKVRELDTTTVRRARIICDSVEACLVEAGDLLIPIAEGSLDKTAIQISLGKIICGEQKGRVNDDEITLFKSVGLAFQDVSVARIVYERAKEGGLGTEFEFF